MKKLLTILILLLAVASQGWAEETTLWEGEYTDGVELNSETVATFVAGDVLRVYVTVPESGANFKIVYKGSPDWSETTIPSIGTQWPWVNGGETYKDFTLTAEDIEALRGKNIYIYKGENSTITKVTMANEATITSNTISLNTTIPASKLTNVLAGDVVKFTVASVSAANLNLSLKVAGGEWHTCNTFGSVKGETTYSYQITGTDIEKGLKTYGMSFEKPDGTTIAVSGIKLRTNGEVPADPTLSLNNFEGENYNKTTHTLTLTSWGSISLDLGLSTSSQGRKLIFKTSSACNLKMSGTYLDGTNIPTVEESGDGTLNHVLALDENNFVKTIKVETGSTVTFTELALDPTYTLTKSATNGSISVSTDGGTSTTEETIFEYGAELTLTATPAAGYNFVNWTDDNSSNAEVSTNAEYTFTISANTSLTANFALIPTKDLSTGSRKIRSNSSLSISHGKFENLSVGDVLTLAISDIRDGATYTLKGYNEATGDDAGYNWQGFGDGAYTVDNEKITCVLTENILNIIKKAGLFIEGTGYTVGNITVRTNGDVTAGAHTDETYTLTINEVIGGSVTVKQGGNITADRTFPMETEITLEPVANTGFTFSKWMKGDTEQTAGENNSLTLSITDNVSVTALFNAQALADNSSLTIWQGEKESSWGELLQLTSSVTNILERFETIKITASQMESVTDPSAYFKVFFNTIGGDSKIVDWESAKITEADQVAEYNLPTTTIVDQLKGGFGIFGQNVKITKVELYKPNIPVALADEETREVWSNSTGVALNWGNNEISISALDAHILEAGEQVIITTEKTGDWPKAWLAEGSAAVSPTIEGTECKITLTSALVDQIKNGFYVSGGDATAKKIEFYKPVVIFIDGKANLDRGTESSGSTTLTAPHDEAVTGNVMVVNLTETNPDAKVKVTYSDGSSIEIAPSKRKVGTPTATQVVVPLNMEKYIKSVSVNTAKAKISEIYMTTISAFEADASNFVADLSLAKAQDNVLYNPSTYTIAASTGWTGIALSKNSADADIKGAEVKITFEGDAQVKTTVYYTDDTNTGDAGSMSEAASSQKLKIDATKTIREIQIQPTSASVVQLKEVRVNATETEDEPEGGDDDDEPVIDEKTGEADLTELTAQNDTKTTLTQNEDGSITMTTTEAYCAAQIWFNDPETVTGNVLKVELAESKVNVTVTVKYTDGTESQMSANTKAVVSARATTRAVASGTTIEVPLETGKEVQNIEVKNNEAGTITIKKMQVTTINVFTGGVANLAMLKPQSNATYDTSAHTLATTKGWTGATVSPVAGENVSGKELLIEFADASKVKVAVKYRTDVEGPSTIMEKAAKAVRLALDNSKNIQEISIQPTEAAIVTFTKIAVNSEESDDGSLKPGKTITLWESATGETLSWNEVAKQDASVGEMLKEYDELLITVSGVVKDCDWPKLFIRDASSEQAGNEVLLNDVGSFPYTVRIVLTGEMAQQLQKGFSICGDGVTVKKLQVYRPEAPKTGDIHLADLNYGYNSSYDKGSHTITTTARWAARGWEIGDKRYNDKNLITVKFEAVDFPVTLKMEYTTGLQTAQATSVGVPAGRTELLLEIPKGISKLNRVYIIYENPGKVKLTEASVTYMENLKLSTAIQAFEADGVIRDGRYDTDGWYNLRGMRIPEPTTSGIYIHGGKKVVIY